ncbi:HlyD family type I secretion periplasmic adaptor subunit [Roseovarius sp. S4756]|uniref:HlyD family type I secretion periplasmic adaptor subunit n=1 Tax=Roseovarius maritimus TaxID=3342637 RepID=UPI0037269525
MSRRDLIERMPSEVAFSNRMPNLKLPKAPPTRVRHLILVLFLLGFGLVGGVGSWAALAPMTSAVVAMGSFKVDGDTLVVQHFEGGIVRDLRVREGDRVEKGDVLIALDGTRSEAQIGILTGQLASALAQDQRLAAEYKNAKTFEPEGELRALIAADPSLGVVEENQRDIFDSNIEMNEGQISILKERLGQLDEQIVGLTSRHDALVKQQALIEEDVRDLKQLFDQGLTTKSRFTRRRQDEIAVFGDIGKTEADLMDLRQRRSEVEQRILQVRRDQLLEIAANRQSVQDRLFDIRQRMSAMKDVQERLAITAPASGQVLGLNINTLGEVIEPGQVLLEIVPEDVEYVIEAQVRPADVDEVVLGQTARVRLTAYSFRTTAPVTGEVVYVSGDSFTDANTSAQFYRVDIKVPDSEFAALPGVHVQPGMPAQVMLETGEQTLVDYMLNPVLGGLETGLTEGGN